uniref:N-terminal Ras-GEF domain-containing protein n=1 Tax=Steinernema glaseri TaxID=37863 RepID=A0A1I7ZU08_9BILA
MSRLLFTLASEPHEVPVQWYLFNIDYGGPLVGQEFANLSRLLQNGDFDGVLLPTKFVDDECEQQQKSITYPKLLAITSGADVLEALDVTEWLVLRTKDDQSKPTELRGGPRDALIVYATQPAGSLLYQEAFLTTYRTFVPSQDLIQKLIKRYHFTNNAGNSSLIKSARQTFSVLVRVVDELCAVELNRLLIETVTSFVYKLILNGEYIFAKILRNRLMERIEHKSGFKANTSLFEYSPSAKTPTLFDFSSTAIARQMTYLDSELFQRIE